MRFEVNSQTINCTERDSLVSGTIGKYRALFSFDPSWDGLVVHAVFRASTSAGISKVERKGLLGDDHTCEVPFKVLAEPDRTLWAGVYGINASGALIVPTIWCRVGYISGGTPTDAAPGQDPTPTIAEQMSAEFAATRSAVAEDADRAEAASLRGPKLGDNGEWFVWDPALGVYVDTGVYSGGEAPYIGANGNWYVGQNDTGIHATGPVGPPGPSGKDGTDGQTGKDGSDGAPGAVGHAVPPGPAGVSGLLSVTRTAEWQLGLDANTCTVVEGAPLSLSVALGAPVAETDTEWRLIFRAGSNFHLEDTAPDGYAVRWESEPAWVAGKIYEISYGNEFLTDVDGNVVIGVLWRAWE